MLPFLTAKNIVDKELVEASPWDFSPSPELLETMRSKKKDARRVLMITPGTKWEVYTTVVGEAKNQRVNAVQNPPRALRGLSVDYDAILNLDAVQGLINQMPEAFQPQFLEITLGKKNRLVWVFEHELLVAGFEYCTAAMKAFVERMGLDTLLPGFDQASTKPGEVWTNGGEWYELKSTPVPSDIVRGIAIDLAKKKSSMTNREQIPMVVVAEEVTRRWPNRWNGDFVLNATGVRFWDEQADCPTGCQVKEDGMLCFTGKVPFVSWADLFGPAWVDEQRALNMGKAADGVYYDGQNYWEQLGDRWIPRNRTDTILLLKDRGLSDKAPKGIVMSDAERVLRHIQGVAGWIDGAAPFVNRRPGLIDVSGKRMLNTSTFKPMVPSEKIEGDPVIDFPFLWRFLNGYFARPEGRPLDHWLGWLQRFYSGMVNYEPMMGQAQFHCGPPGNGKTLLCIRVVGGLCNGRMSTPIDFFYGDTTFNDEIFESPFIAINDEDSPKTESAKAKYATKIKAFTVNPTHTHHAKFRGRNMTEWVGRIFVTLNDDPYSVIVLPEVNSNTFDKMSFYASQPFLGEWPANTNLTIANELPKFAKWLLDYYKLPVDLRSSDVRTGIKSYYDPVILDLSKQQVVAYNLVELLQIWTHIDGDMTDKKQWSGTPSELLARLSVSTQLAVLLKDWTVARISKSLTTLARQGGTGISYDEGARTFKIESDKLTK